MSSFHLYVWSSCKLVRCGCVSRDESSHLCVNRHLDLQLMGNSAAGRSKTSEMKNGDCSNAKSTAYVSLAARKLSFLGAKRRFVGSAKNVLFGTVLNVLIVAVPLAILSNYLRIGNVSHLKQTENSILVAVICTLTSISTRLTWRIMWLSLKLTKCSNVVVFAVVGFRPQFDRNHPLGGTTGICYRVSLFTWSRFFLIPICFTACDKVSTGKANSLCNRGIVSEFWLILLWDYVRQLAYFTGPTVGGLLNATFGNATEMIICVFALQNNMVRVVQLSLLGSILSNMLLVLGCSFLFGGFATSKKEQTFDKVIIGQMFRFFAKIAQNLFSFEFHVGPFWTFLLRKSYRHSSDFCWWLFFSWRSQSAAHLNSSLLLMAVMCVLFPAALHATGTEVHLGQSELTLSRITSCVMLVAYAGYIWFQIRNPLSLLEEVTTKSNLLIILKIRLLTSQCMLERVSSWGMYDSLLWMLRWHL